MTGADRFSVPDRSYGRFLRRTAMKVAALLCVGAIALAGVGMAPDAPGNEIKVSASGLN
jgi:hypothetical protein